MRAPMPDVRENLRQIKPPCRLQLPADKEIKAFERRFLIWFCSSCSSQPCAGMGPIKKKFACLFEAGKKGFAKGRGTLSGCGEINNKKSPPGGSAFLRIAPKGEKAADRSGEKGKRKTSPLQSWSFFFFWLAHCIDYRARVTLPERRQRVQA